MATTTASSGSCCISSRPSACSLERVPRFRERHVMHGCRTPSGQVGDTHQGVAWRSTACRLNATTEPEEQSGDAVMREGCDRGKS